MRKTWLWVLMLGLALGAPGLGLGQQEAQKKPPAEAAAPAAKPGAAAEKGVPTATAGGPAAAGKDAAALATPGGPAAALPPVVPPPVPMVVLPRPVDVEVFDVPNDNGTGVGVLWNWEGSTTETTTVTIETEVAASILDKYRLTADEQSKLDSARAELAQGLSSLTGPRDESDAALKATEADLTLAQNNRDPQYFTLLKDKWQKAEELARLERLIGLLRDRYLSKVQKLDVKDQRFRYFEATLAASPWLATNIDGPAADIGTKADSANRFGQDPSEAAKFYAEINQMVALNPAAVAGTYDNSVKNEYDQIPPQALQLPLDKNVLHNMRMVVKDGDQQAIYDLGGTVSRVNFFNFAVLNNLIFAVLFCIVILTAIVIARRNPNLFIRRINGLEAVDEAIGRATEMGKPVLYLTGTDPLSSLSTLAAINILGRVARKIADYDSDLIVPCKDPVALTVAQEVVREAYTDQGRPDAYREDNIYFVTDDQFSFAASVCAIMIREKPAANFLMGYYYAEALLLAETGATTGAIQIAGTDSISQLPFFITTCDYTLIGEELYAASAYLSREPLLLGSLRGQDIGKALVMILIILQTVMFLINSELDFLRKLVEPL